MTDERARAKLLKRLESIRDGWEAADAYGKGMLEITARRGAVGSTVASSPSAPAIGSRITDMSNPGAVFDTPAEAADAMIDGVNARSVAENGEYHWTYYQDPATGKYGYSDPYWQGPAGGQKVRLKLSVDGKPLAASWTIGMGHTHGDYSRRVSGQVQRTDKAHDGFNSDQFSSPGSAGGPADWPFMRRGGNQGNWNFFTLGTPSGRFRMYSPQTGEMGMVRMAAPSLSAQPASLLLSNQVKPLYLEKDK